MTTPIQILKQYWGYDRFRPLQEEIVQAVLDGHHVLALLPTGGGKSVCLQVPALCSEGLCIVISPLIALMKDQVHQLNERGIKALAIYSGMSKREIDIALDNCIFGNIKFLYVSPERIKTELFIERARKMKINLLAVDEAHCISQWGYDFRPPYLEIRKFIETLGLTKVIALTASATKEVKADITEKLGMKEPKIFQRSFARLNLSYSIFRLEDKDRKMLEILRNVPGSGIVYVRSRKRTQEIAAVLKKNSISADFYHAGLDVNTRSARQEAWIKNKVRVMVATNAFGMGIDKADVRTVIHYDLPDSLEAYYQEAGRAGRDERKAYAVVLYHEEDLESLQLRAERSSVSVEFMKRIYQALANYYKLAVGSNAFSSFPFMYQDFISNFNLPIVETYHALKKLGDEGFIQLSEGFKEDSKVIFLQTAEETYRFQVAHQSLDRILKALLRLYGGEVYTDYISIREKDIASMLRDSESSVVKALEYLHQLDMIEYVRKSGNNQITFLTPRYDVNDLPVDKKRIDWRRKVTLEKAEAVAEYVKNETRCRTQAIQNYFDEQSEEDCGICDICLKRHKRQPEKLPLKEVMNILSDRPMSFTDLQMNLKREVDQPTLLAAVRVLLDENRIKLDNNQLFSL